MLDLIKQLISQYNYTIKTFRPYGIFSCVKAEQIKIEDTATTEMFLNILNILTEEFGEPIFVHSYYGFIFERDKKYIACNIIEENYGYDVLDIFIFKKIPLGKKIAYSTYLQVDNTVKIFADEMSLNFTFGNHYAENQFLYYIGNNRFQILITIKKTELLYYILKVVPEETGTRAIPQYNGKKIISLSEISLQKGLNEVKSKLKELELL